MAESYSIVYAPQLLEPVVHQGTLCLCAGLAHGERCLRLKVPGPPLPPPVGRTAAPPARGMQSDAPWGREHPLCIWGFPATFGGLSSPGLAGVEPNGGLCAVPEGLSSRLGSPLLGFGSADLGV